MSAALDDRPFAGGALAGIGDPRGLLLGGPDEDAGAETLAGLLDRLGELPRLSADVLTELVAGAGLCGRGGGQFPLARKLESLRAGLGDGGPPAVVVNLSESEPASRKDRTLARLRPHLVLDGAALVARALGARDAVLHLHDGEYAAVAALRMAAAERADHGLDDPTWTVSTAPRGYVAGESSAVLSAVEGGRPLPRWSPVPATVRGLHGPPTLLSNGETFAQLAVLARLGADQWRSLGPNPWSGPLLVTVQGAVGRRGEVIEVLGTASIGDVLAYADAPRPAAVLVGGYAGTWVDGPTAAGLALDRAALASAGATIGCGLLAVLPAGHCGLAETARLVGWLAAEGAGQCGPCAFGLPRMGTAAEALARGRGRAVDLLLRLADEVDGRGGCRHPDGVARLARSAVTTFEADVRRHRWGRTCGGDTRPVLPLPTRSPSWR
jgi:NADH:ubiquinone oxidoreductase subunit F (NADH-binding)